MDSTQTAIRLQKARQKNVHSATSSLESRENLTREKLVHYKLVLAQSVSAHDTEAIKKFLKKIIRVRAELCTLELEKAQKNFDTEKMDKIVTEYYKECFQLKNSFQIFF